MQHQLSSLVDLGREVARLRKAKGLTQKQLGALAGMGQSTLARFETGQVAEFGSRKLLRLLEVLGYGLMVTNERTPFTLDDALRVRRNEVDQSASESTAPKLEARL
jgi:transcriptional regulator with XRE-family HTH domain